MKKILSIIITLMLLIGGLTACNNGGTEPSFTRLTQWDYHPGYHFLLTSVEEQGDSLLLRGVIARDVLTPEEVETARAEGSIEINGEIFTHSDVDTAGFTPTDRLYSESSSTEIFLVTAFFGEFEGDDIMYRMMKNDEQTHFHHFFKITGMYREIEVDKTTPIEIYRKVTEPREWGYLEMFAPIETSVHVFSNRTEYDLPEGFPFEGSFFLIFEDGNCVFLRWVP